ncbi:hypothetical protein ACMFMG_009550 [Clarireedia jacksonii]
MAAWPEEGLLPISPGAQSSKARRTTAEDIAGVILENSLGRLCALAPQTLIDWIVVKHRISDSLECLTLDFTCSATTLSKLVSNGKYFRRSVA